MIQGLSADITKLAALYIMDAIKDSSCRLISMVHDEVICDIPGYVTLNLDKCKFDKDGCFKPAYIPDPEAKHWADTIQQCMEDAETDIFAPIYPLKGKAEAAVAPYWDH